MPLQFPLFGIDLHLACFGGRYPKRVALNLKDALAIRSVPVSWAW